MSGISIQELAAQFGELLPEREALGCIRSFDLGHIVPCHPAPCHPEPCNVPPHHCDHQEYNPCGDSDKDHFPCSDGGYSRGNG